MILLPRIIVTLIALTAVFLGALLVWFDVTGEIHWDADIFGFRIRAMSTKVGIGFVLAGVTLGALVILRPSKHMTTTKTTTIPEPEWELSPEAFEPVALSAKVLMALHELKEILLSAIIPMVLELHGQREGGRAKNALPNWLEEEKPYLAFSVFNAIDAVLTKPTIRSVALMVPVLCWLRNVILRPRPQSPSVPPQGRLTVQRPSKLPPFVDPEKLRDYHRGLDNGGSSCLDEVIIRISPCSDRLVELINDVLPETEHYVVLCQSLWRRRYPPQVITETTVTRSGSRATPP